MTPQIFGCLKFRRLILPMPGSFTARSKLPREIPNYQRKSYATAALLTTLKLPVTQSVGCHKHDMSMLLKYKVQVLYMVGLTI